MDTGFYAQMGANLGPDRQLHFWPPTNRQQSSSLLPDLHQLHRFPQWQTIKAESDVSRIATYQIWINTFVFAQLSKQS